MNTSSQAQVWLVAGLGNPGKEYERTRHNIGFACVDSIQENLVPATTTWKNENNALFISCDLSLKRTKHRVLLVKPQSYMNRSGEPLAKIAGFYKVPASQIIVVHDELDLPLGTVRIRLGGGLAGHNGLKSIQQQVGTPDFYRVRLGIGRPPIAEMEMAAWVLAKFSSEEAGVVAEMSRRGVGAVEELITSGLKSAQNLYNS